MKENIFQSLFVLDLANNHFGDLNYAKKIINSFSSIIKKKKIKASIKFQFRDLKTFVHKSEIHNDKNKYVKRFLSTEMSLNKFSELKNYIKKKGFLTSCTPFDENSVKVIEDMKFDILKIASVSSNDWSLLERVAQNNIPKLISTGGRSIDEIDKIVSFFDHKKQNFALMHCVSIYPSPNETLQLNVISDLIKRYPKIVIGWSTHENPNDTLPSTLAYSSGARIFEKHIGIESKKHKLNNYSTTPKQFLKYLDNLENVKNTLGHENKKVLKKEVETLELLERGVYAKENLVKNKKLTSDNTYFAFPKKKNQLSTANFSLKTKNYQILDNVYKDKPITNSKVKVIENKHLSYITSYIHKVKAMLSYAKIDVGSDFDLEISHHYGVLNFSKYGCFLFNCINRSYAKKILLLVPNQKHPLHKHKLKEETFQILSGVLYSEVDGKDTKLYPGDSQVVKPGVWHRFRAGKEGCIFEEVSTTHFNDDSIYQDTKINKMTRNQRKTFIKNWGTHELSLNVFK